MAKLYKEQSQNGYSKMLPQVALGHSQSAILATAEFENDVLELINIFTPLLSSNTMSSDALKKDKNETGKKPKAQEEEKKAGRQEKPDDEKSEKTIANRESMN
jgi:hypothetical protein